MVPKLSRVGDPELTPVWCVLDGTYLRRCWDAERTVDGELCKLGGVFSVDEKEDNTFAALSKVTKHEETR